jgi:hypothetical protein
MYTKHMVDLDIKRPFLRVQKITFLIKIVLLQ